MQVQTRARVDNDEHKEAVLYDRAIHLVRTCAWIERQRLIDHKECVLPARVTHQVLDSPQECLLTIGICCVTCFCCLRHRCAVDFKVKRSRCSR